MPINQLSVFLPNKPGQLASFFELLMENKIYIYSLTVAETEEYGLLLLLVDKPRRCFELLEEKGYLYSITEIVTVKLSNNISELYNIAKTLGSQQINIEYLYFLALKGNENGIVLKLDDNEKGIRILKEKGYHVLEVLD
jgi:hypothetical protein